MHRPSNRVTPSVITPIPVTLLPPASCPFRPILKPSPSKLGKNTSFTFFSRTSSSDGEPTKSKNQERTHEGAPLRTLVQLGLGKAVLEKKEMEEKVGWYCFRLQSRSVKHLCSRDALERSRKGGVCVHGAGPQILFKYPRAPTSGFRVLMSASTTISPRGRFWRERREWERVRVGKRKSGGWAWGGCGACDRKDRARKRIVGINRYQRHTRMRVCS
ncbi:hypothetical protein BDP27DRAFT_1367644 [Rhodocollybia butyracea]|uniref:Uncharacterized protein n=1 Tax=Rhodocollybia butyracea TaxID=206335 RepID=A0A9P5PJQ4_9AGAR|nr:hypothetical protein BDP27DRAFT_1367644 [Rhodocollybia butyracea]